MPNETNTIDTLTKLASEHWNDTTVKVSNRNKAIVESIEDHNQGYPNQENNGHYYRYTVTYINGVDYGCNTLEEIRSHIVTSGKYDYDDIVKEYFEDQETKPEIKEGDLSDEIIDYINSDTVNTEVALSMIETMKAMIPEPNRYNTDKNTHVDTETQLKSELDTEYILLDKIKESDKFYTIITSEHKRVKTGDKVVSFFPHLQYNEFKIIGIHYKSETVTIANTKGFIQSYNVSFEKLERDFKESFTEKPIKIKGAV